ncbi:hypothetical protein D1646_18860 [Pseudoflavonifractor sp. 60]|nr:hypothetical protein [Pseudoflavonifractor sp. 60]
MPFYDDKGRQHFLLLPLVYSTAKTDGAVNGGRSPFILTVDWLGWFCYSYFFNNCLNITIPITI